MVELDSPIKSLIRFNPFCSIVKSTFWYKFCDLKLNEDKLEEVQRRLYGYYSYAERTGSLFVDYTSFNKDYDNFPMTSIAHGFHINTNTIEKFRSINKNELLAEYGQKLLQSIENEDAINDPTKLINFLLLTYVDLKKYVFHYWFAFPALLDYLYYQNDTPKSLETVFTSDQVRALAEAHESLDENQRSFFCFTTDKTNLNVFPICQFVNDTDIHENIFIAFLDPTNLQDIPGWPLRNLLSLFQIKCPNVFKKSLKVVSIRGDSSQWGPKSVIFTINTCKKAEQAQEQESFLGWEKNTKGKLSPRTVNLSEDMDPSKLSSKAVDLNLKLVKWRLQPDLDLDVLKKTSCLLLGAGTLGCSVARVLVAWGIENITFVDNGVVSYSNPARQSLYTFDDSRNGAKKATTAAAALKMIHPGLNAKGEVLTIHTPGCNDYDMENVYKLDKVIQNHDIIFLLTDSRESRWLPTLLAAAYKKVVITIALGYDSYLVMRHGVAEQIDAGGGEKPLSKLGCYFCNDVVAPGDSQVDRTLDQQCTVTRPGLSGIAASYGVELLVAMLQHPKKGLATGNDTSCLGKIPHSIRGFIADHEYMYPSTTAFENCVACSKIIVDKYIENAENFCKMVFTNKKYLEEVAELSRYQCVDEDDLDFPDDDINDE